MKINKAPLRVRLFLQWIQFWASIGGLLFGVGMQTGDEIYKEEDGKDNND